MATWDERKRQANIAKHGLDFEGCEAIFDNLIVTCEDDREAYGEQRLNVVGWLKRRFVRLTYTERNGEVHVISLREAKPDEFERYNRTFPSNRR